MGKTSLLECINLSLTNQINGKFIIYDLTEYMFNIEIVKEYLDKVKSGQVAKLPKLNTLTNGITEKEIAVSIDVSSKSNWETALTSYLDEVHFSYAGQGEQSSIKMKLSLKSNVQDCNIVLIEELENHLSFSNMSKLINEISSKCEGKQLIITTHSPYVANKLGLENLILFGDNRERISLYDLIIETTKYFKSY